MKRLAVFITATAASLAALGTASAWAVAPEIPLTTFSITAGAVTLEADINPQGKATLYHFEYGLANCASSLCTSVPIPNAKLSPAEVPAGKTAARVKAVVEGLTPGTTYHFRVVAKNSPTDITEGSDATFTTYPLALASGACPNDLFRTGNLAPPGEPSNALSDCRAYEQASPVDKNGLSVTGTYPTIKASPAGDAISFATVGGIPNDEGAQDVPIQLARRGQSDWSTQGLLPPPSAGQRATVKGWTPDFSAVFDRALKFGTPNVVALLSRSSADGSLTPVIPYGDTGGNPSPYFIADTSADGSKVFFESVGTGPGAQLTPEAALDKGNLYVWDRESETTSLVGVLPDADCAPAPCAPPGGSAAGPYNWVKGEEAIGGGGARSDYYIQEEHAISSDGSRAYFTAGDSGQIYLREDPTGPGAETVHVSATQRDEGNGPGGSDAAGTRPAAFIAATADGSSAFLTSSEKLTNDATTGPEPTEPSAIARADINGTPASLEPSFLPTHALGVAVDGSHIYWAEPDEDAIGRANLSGGEIDKEFITGADNPRYVAVDAGHIYWSNAGEGKKEEGTIGRAKLASTEAEEVEEDFIEGATNPQGVAVDAGHVYWGNAGNGEGDYTKAIRTIGRADIGGSPASVEQEFINTNAPGGPSQEFSPQGIAVNATHIYVAIVGTQQTSFIFRYDLDGEATSRKLVEDKNQAHLRGIALDAGHVYWSRQAEDAIGRANLELEEVNKEFIKDARHPGGLAVDAAHLYWSDNQEILPNPGKDLYRYDVGTGKLSDLVVDGADDNGAEVRGVLDVSGDGSFVYFLANGVLSSVPNGSESALPGTCHGQTLGSETGTCNLYLAHEGQISFIARLQAGADLTDWTPTATGVIIASSRFQKSAQLSVDGHTLLFSSVRKLGAYDNQGKPELYRYRFGEPGLICVSCNPTGAAPVSAPTTSIEPPLQIPGNVPMAILSRNLSADGDRVFFESTDALVGADTNGIEGCPRVGSEQQNFSGCQDVYEWEANGSGSCHSEAQNGGCLYLLSTGDSTYPSFFADASASGDDAFIITASPGLVRQDGDQLLDVYDARVGGGLASQNEVKPECDGEPCKGPAPSPPPFESPQNGAGPNVNAKRPSCPKPKKTKKAKHGSTASKGKKARCGKKSHKHQGKGKHRDAKRKGRASR